MQKQLNENLSITLSRRVATIDLLNSDGTLSLSLIATPCAPTTDHLHLLLVSFYQ